MPPKNTKIWHKVIFLRAYYWPAQEVLPFIAVVSQFPRLPGR